MNGAGYELEQAEEETVDGYRMAFRRSYWERGSKEVITSFRYTRHSPKDYWNGTIMWGDAQPTQNFIEMFTMKDGTPISESTDYDEMNNPYGLEGENPKYNRDPRLYETIILNRAKWGGKKIIICAQDNKPRPEFNFRISCAISRKFVPEKDQVDNPNWHFAFGRVSHVYLIHAEAANELGKRTEAIESLNKIRNRVGMKNIEVIHPDVASWTTEKFREEILTERCKEFYMEESRWYDMTRWKKKECFEKVLYKPYIQRQEDGSFVYKSQEIVEFPRFWKDNFDAKWYLNCFPFTEVQKKYGLTQNPGW